MHRRVPCTPRNDTGHLCCYILESVTEVHPSCCIYHSVYPVLLVLKTSQRSGQSENSLGCSVRHCKLFRYLSGMLFSTLALSRPSVITFPSKQLNMNSGRNYDYQPIMHRLGCDTSLALFYDWVWFLCLRNLAWKHPWHLCWIWMPTHPASSGGSVTQLSPMHTIIYNGCVCLQPSIRINTCWGRAEDSLVSPRTQDPASTSPNKLFILEQHSVWKMNQSSGSRSWWPTQFACRYGWDWSTANCNLNPFS